MSSNVVQFPTRQPIQSAPAPSYTIDVYDDPNKLDFVVRSGNEVTSERVASDLIDMALSFQPPRQTFWQRLRYLFIGDDA